MISPIQWLFDVKYENFTRCSLLAWVDFEQMQEEHFFSIDYMYIKIFYTKIN